jgi:cellulose synthase/poly-beta-1,6-N-acetylglucosamine synthase-like glycosyltransferase
VNNKVTYTGLPKGTHKVSVLEPDALRIIVQGFADESVGSIAGHATVLNVHESWLTKMQAVRHFVAFKVNKTAESVFDGGLGVDGAAPGWPI